jgi:hypothetical protein
MQQESKFEDQKASRLTQRGRVIGVERAIQQQTVAINRGLFLVRYAAAEDEAQPPRVMVSPDPASDKDIRFLLHPDHNEAVLWQADTCLVVQAMAPGMLSVQVIPVRDDGSVAATVRIEPLSQGIAPSPSLKARNRSSAPRDSDNLSILGHVSGIGDIVVDSGEWLAGPSAPSRIEGISIDWPGKPADLDINYAVKTAKPQTTSGRKMPMGSFAGTRGRAMPIVSLMLDMSGSGAADFEFSVEAIFLGSPAMHITGQHVVASGPTGREPLVGLRIGLEPVGVAAASKTKPSANELERPTGRARVFRSRQNRDQPVPA